MAVIHPMVKQLYFTRSEFKRELKGLSEADARKRISPMNCISWNVGHLTWQEHRDSGIGEASARLFAKHG